ncbi:hypothetical protein [Chamaesiphon sp. OTE_20_metabat_361]|uniref:hypothetical protein n=1 Tax=Chamaesiphon sp. OTE_20_metabat_361 TaxID=2964689 RepID=UPI00286B460A|nr:hypothetical protein [Chamaesiphon sp. OTE_20_metabat_361]
MAIDLLTYLHVASDLHHSYPAAIPTGILIRIPKIGLLDRYINDRAMIAQINVQ